MDDQERPKVRKQLQRATSLQFFAQLLPCEIGIDGFDSAHYWGRELTKLGHTVKPHAGQERCERCRGYL